MPNMDGMANGGVESPETEERQSVPKSSPAAAAAPSKGRGIRRWRRVRREQQRQGNTPTAAGDGSASNGRSRGDDNTALLQKRRIPLLAGAPKAKHESPPVVEDESSTASVESRIIPRPPAKLDPGLGGFRVESAAFAIGADSDHSDDRSSRSSTGASALRVLTRYGHDKHARAGQSRADRLMVVHASAGSTEAENSRSSVESDLRNSNGMKAPHLGVGIAGNGIHKALSDSGDHGDEGQPSQVPSEDVRSTAAGGCYQENGNSFLGKLAQGNSDNSNDDVGDTLDEGSMRNGQNGGLHSGADPYAESVLLLQTTQEALENEIEKVLAVGKVPSDEFNIYDEECSGSVHLEDPIEEVSERIKHLESRLKEASALIKEKDARIVELGTLSRSQAAEKTAIESTTLLLSQSELDGLYQEKIQTEIQLVILTGACETLATLADDQMALYEAQKSLSEDYKQLGLKLRHAENRAMVLEEKAEKLQMQCKELSSSSEVLQLQSKASRASLFCFVQFMLLCIVVGTYLMRLVPSTSSEVVPT